MEEILLIVLLIFLSFVFSGSEVAFFSLPKTRLRRLKSRKVASLLDYLISRPYTLLSTILLGNTAVNAFAASIFSVFITNLLVGHHFSESTLTIIDVAVFTLLLLIFGEITPKIIALQYPLTFSSLSWVLIYPFYFFFYPIVKPLGRWMRVIFESDEKSKEIEPITLKEVYNIVETAKGFLRIEELELLEDSVEFLSIKVSDIMTPRKDIHALPHDATIKDAMEEMRKTRHSRFPVYRNNIDDIVGVVDLLNIEEILKIPGDSPISDFMQEPLFVPETMDLPDLVKTLTETPTQMAIVVDEYGGTEGVVTMKDAYKHFLGKIRSDFESEELEEVKKIGKNSYLLSGDISISVLERLSGRRFGYYGSLSNYILDNLGYVPTEGEKVEINGVIFEILSKEGESPDKVKVTIK